MDLSGFCGKRICVAVSGGVDSMALLHFLQNAQKKYGYALSAVHCEHGIRGAESVEDMRFVEECCRAQGVPLYLYRENCPLKAKTEKSSLETAARAFRYAAFAELVEEGKTDYIATAHHQGDSAETVLFRIARGCSLTGARGIAEQNGYIVRPFLHWKKSEILAYAQKNGIPYREDKTNFETDATRNKLRLQVFPLLESAIPNATENLTRFAALAAEDDELLYEQSEKLTEYTSKDGKKRACVAFCEKRPLFRRACLSAMKYLGVESDYTLAHLESVYALQSAERGARVCLPRGVEAEKTERGVRFYLVDDEEELSPLPDVEEPFDENGFDGGRYEVNISDSEWKGTENGWRVLRVDADKIPKNAVYRFRREGDRFQKFGGGTQTLKKFFNEKKLPPKERAFLPLIAEKNGNEVYAVCGVEISEKLKTDENTRRVLYIGVRKK